MVVSVNKNWWLDRKIAQKQQDNRTTATAVWASYLLSSFRSSLDLTRFLRAGRVETPILMLMNQKPVGIISIAKMNNTHAGNHPRIRRNHGWFGATRWLVRWCTLPPARLCRLPPAIARTGGGRFMDQTLYHVHGGYVLGYHRGARSFMSLLASRSFAALPTIQRCLVFEGCMLVLPVRTWFEPWSLVRRRRGGRVVCSHTSVQLGNWKWAPALLLLQTRKNRNMWYNDRFVLHTLCGSQNGRNYGSNGGW